MKRASNGVTFETVRACALLLPEVEEGTSYGTSAFRVRKKLFVRLREDGETLAIKADFDERETLMGADPETFFITEHYRNYPMVLVRLAKVDAETLRDLLAQAWRHSAPPRLLAAVAAGSAAPAPAQAPPPRRTKKTAKGGTDVSASSRVDRPRRRAHRQ